MTALFEFGQVQIIAEEDSVQFVDFVEEPLEEQNDGARNAANVTPLAGIPFSLTGAGVTALVYDGGQVDAAHPDFGARVTQGDGAALSDHATHVAGTVGGSGVNSVPNGACTKPVGWDGSGSQHPFVRHNG